MAWSKIKTIIIAILLVLNLFLALLVAGQQISAKRYQSNTLRQTVDALSLNGITVADDALPTAMKLSGTTFSRSTAVESAMAELLLSGDIINTSSGSMHVYSSVSGNVSFRSNGDFSATLNLDCSQFDSFADHAAALLKEMDVPFWSITADSNRNTVTVIQTVDNAPAFNARLTLTYAHNQLLSMEGKLLLGNSVPDSEPGTSVSIPTALVSFLEYIVDSGTVCRSINRVTSGYLTTTSLSDTIRLTPCWFVETDTANYYLDAATGSVTKAN